MMPSNRRAWMGAKSRPAAIRRLLRPQLAGITSVNDLHAIIIMPRCRALIKLTPALSSVILLPLLTLFKIMQLLEYLLCTSCACGWDVVVTRFRQFFGRLRDV